MTGLKRTAEGLGRLTRQQRGEVVDRDDGDTRAALEAVDRNRGLVEGGGNGVDGDRGEGGGGVLQEKKMCQ